MQIRIWIVVATLAVAGCESTPERVDPPITEQPAAVEPVADELAADVGTDASQPDTDSAVEKPAEPETKVLERRDDVAEFADGTRVTLVRNSHKHRVGGGSVGIWGFRFEKDGREPIEFEVRGERLHAEGEAFERVYLLKWNDGVVELTLFPPADDPWSRDEEMHPFEHEPLSREEATEIAKSKVEGLELDLSDMPPSISTRRGILIYTGYSERDAPVVRVRVGLYTRDVEVEVDRDAKPRPKLDGGLAPCGSCKF